jgi:hypothetical protein
MYSLLIDTYIYIKNQLEKLHLPSTIETVLCVQHKHKANWALKWCNSNKSFVKHTIAFAAVEGIFFSGSSCAIFWHKN